MSGARHWEILRVFDEAGVMNCNNNRGRTEERRRVWNVNKIRPAGPRLPVQLRPQTNDGVPRNPAPEETARNARRGFGRRNVSDEIDFRIQSSVFMQQATHVNFVAG